MDPQFGKYVRRKRLDLLKKDCGFTLRQVAKAVGVQPSFISKVENGLVLPSEGKIVALAAVLKEDPDVLLALAGKVSRDLREAITRRPLLFAQLIRELKDAPEQAVLRVVREVRDGTW